MHLLPFRPGFGLALNESAISHPDLPMLRSQGVAALAAAAARLLVRRPLSAMPAPAASGSALRLALAPIKPAQVTSPKVVMKKYNPYTPSMRHRLIVNKKDLWRGRPVGELTERIKSHAGRNVHGHITVRGRMAPKHRRMYRLVDFKRRRTDPATVQRFEYDPNRSAFIALIRYPSDGALSYILSPHDLEEGAVLRSGEGAPFEPGNARRRSSTDVARQRQPRRAAGLALPQGGGPCAPTCPSRAHPVAARVRSAIPCAAGDGHGADP